MEKAQNIEVKPTSLSDFEALVAIRISSMKESLTAIGRFDPVRTRNRLLNSFSPESTFRIFYNENLCGFYSLIFDSNLYKLDHFYIAPEFQNLGIGSVVLRQIVDSLEIGSSIKLFALKQSRANRFYQKLGFRLIGEAEFDNIYLFDRL